MVAVETFSASEFKAKCLGILDRLNRRELGEARITKRGKVVAIVGPPPPTEDDVSKLHGWMKGSTFIPEGFDLTAPVLDEPFSSAEEGLLHR